MEVSRSALEIIKILILAEANINAKTANAETPLHMATSPLTSKSTVEQLIVNGAELNAKDINGRTPLHTAVNNGNVETVDLLIANGGGVNAVDYNGKTPLDLAIENSRSEIIDLLINLGGQTGEELSHKPRLNFIRSPFGFTFNTVEGKPYIVESGISVDKWSKLREFKGTGSEVKFIDMRRIYFQKHFYRLKVFE